MAVAPPPVLRPPRFAASPLPAPGCCGGPGRRGAARPGVRETAAYGPRWLRRVSTRGVGGGRAPGGAADNGSTWGSSETPQGTGAFPLAAMGVTLLLTRPSFLAWKCAYSRDSQNDTSADLMKCRSSEYQQKHLC